MIELAEPAFLYGVADIEIGSGADEIVDCDRNGIRGSAGSRKRNCEYGNEMQGMQRDFHVGSPSWWQVAVTNASCLESEHHSDGVGLTDKPHRSQNGTIGGLPTLLAQFLIGDLRLGSEG